MRLGFILLLIVTSALSAAAPDSTKPLPAKRYGIELDLDKYPQATPKDTLASLLKALEYRRIDYLVAQLADPQFVDQRVRDIHAGKFDSMVEEATAKLTNDPGVMKKLRRFLNEGAWDMQDASASARLPDSPERVHFRKIGARWFLENQDRAK